MKWIALLLILSTQASWATVRSHNIWAMNEITTCFAEVREKRTEVDMGLNVRPWNPENKAKVIKWLREEYTSERTGIHFVGFKDCEVSPEAQVIIFYNKNSHIQRFLFGGLDGLAVVGPQYGYVTGYPQASGYASISKTGMNKATVIHEFGHVAGLRHEHEHRDAYYYEPDCMFTESGSLNYPDSIYDAYDKESVMNYCRLFESGGSRRGLSTSDVSVLKWMYP